MHSCMHVGRYAGVPACLPVSLSHCLCSRLCTCSASARSHCSSNTALAKPQPCHTDGQTNHPTCVACRPSSNYEDPESLLFLSFGWTGTEAGQGNQWSKAFCTWLHGVLQQSGCVTCRLYRRMRRALSTLQVLLRKKLCGSHR